ncbi:hypothetical protein PLANPX_6058 [Lacipirellula parvula]|uniref:Uncharacterized protein n=1 Tax=Lacipirellula parvula TaxID=2650471 RepID=A0A5K7XN72_9BACT|nr:hypothetical protein PLANPX_6058 [Lacipirellula parvula]
MPTIAAELAEISGLKILGKSRGAREFCPTESPASAWRLGNVAGGPRGEK